MTVTATSVGESDQLQPRIAPEARTWARRLVPPAAAALSGLLLYVSFPPRTLWWLALPAFAVFGWVLRGRGWKAGLGLGYLFGLGFLLPLLVWTGVEVGPVPWLALVAIEAVFVAVVGAGVTAVSKLPGWPLWAAAVWIAGEAARARVPFSGFPWGKVAFGQADGVFLPLAALGGTPVLGFAVVLCGFGLYEVVRLAVQARRTGSVRRVAAAVGLLSVAVPVVAAFAARPLVSDKAEDGQRDRRGDPGQRAPRGPRLQLPAAEPYSTTTRARRNAWPLRSRPARSPGPTSCCGRRTPPTSIPSPTPTPAP